MAQQDYYTILGVDKKATSDEIKKAYRKKALDNHPDRHPNDKQAEERFKECADAYSVLGDETKRKRYDQFGHAGTGNVSSTGGGMNMEDIFSRFGDIFGSNNPFETFFGGGNRNRGHHINKGSNLRIKIKLTLEEISTGIEKKVKVGKHIPCDKCDGSGARKDSGFSTCSTCNGSGQTTRTQQTILGYMQFTSECPSCQGEGQIITEKCKSCDGHGIVKGEDVININVPAGSVAGTQLSMSGNGNSIRGGIAGDLIIVVEEIEHPYFKRDGNDIHYNQYLNFADVTIGATIEIPTLDGKAKMKIDAGTQSGKTLRLKGKGIPYLSGYGRGDLLVSINVWTPQHLTSEEKKILEELCESKNFNPK